MHAVERLALQDSCEYEYIISKTDIYSSVTVSGVSFQTS